MRQALCSLYFVLISLSGFAQEIQVVGKVRAKADNATLPGVSIQVKGTTRGTQTNADGSYALALNQGQTLLFSFIGMVSQEIKVLNQSVIDVVLDDSGNELNEVVVLTALGLERKKDDDLSSSSLVDAGAVKRSGESGLIQGLSGKTSGLTVIRNNGDPGSGAYIQIRGQNTISGSSSPLIILDGVPISNTDLHDNINGNLQDVSGVAQQSRLNDLNPDDIANITVLKGAAAAAVWGTGAANGVILIQTKKGNSKGKAVSVELSNTISFDVINREYEKQDKFGQGGSLMEETGRASDAYQYLWNPTVRESWGDRIRDRPGGEDEVRVANKRFESISGKVYYPILSKNDTRIYHDRNREQIFRTGFTWNKVLSVSFNSDRSSNFFSLAHWGQEGIFKANSDYYRTTARVNNETKLSETVRLKVNTSVASVKSNRIQQGSNLNGFYLGYLRTPADFDNSDYIGTYYNSDGVAALHAHRSFIGQQNNLGYLGEGAPFYSNPGWTTFQQENPNTVQRFIVNPELNWKITKGINFVTRFGLDHYTENRETWFPVNSAGDMHQGYFYRADIVERNTSLNAFANGTHILNTNFNLSWIAGVQFEDLFYYNHVGESKIFTNPFVDLLRTFGNANAVNETPKLTRVSIRKSGTYGVLNGEIFNQIYFELTSRYELPSTLLKPVFYPSVSLGWVFSEKFKPKFLSYGKIRASYGQVGIEPVNYATKTIYNAFDRSTSWGESLSASVYGNPFGRSSLSGNPKLEAEKVKEIELGTDLRFLEDKIALGLTYYNRKTTNALLAIDLAPSSGFSSVWNNAATISNKGLEIDLGVRIMKFKDINWRMDVNFSKNKNIVEELKGVKSVNLNGFTGSSSRVVAGQPFGTLWGGKWLRDDQNYLVINSFGFPVLDAEEGIIGDPNPKWKGGIGSNVAWKGLELSFLVETFQGNQTWAGTQGIMKYFGVDTETANEFITKQELRTVDGRVVPAGTLVRGSIGNFGGGDVLLDSRWYTGLGGGFSGPAEQFVVDGSWTKLREVSLNYNLPLKLISKIKLATASIGLSGRNLLIWSPALQYIDPEVNLTGASKGRGLEYFTNPGTGSYIINLKLGI